MTVAISVTRWTLPLLMNREMSQNHLLLHLFHLHLHLLYIWEGDRKLVSFHLQVHSPHALNDWGWGKLKPRARNSIQVSYEGGRVSHTWAITPASQGAHYQEAAIGAELGLKPGRLDVNTGFTTGSLTARPDAYPLQNILNQNKTLPMGGGKSCGKKVLKYTGKVYITNSVFTVVFPKYKQAYGAHRYPLLHSGIAFICKLLSMFFIFFFFQKLFA